MGFGVSDGGLGSWDRVLCDIVIYPFEMECCGCGFVFVCAFRIGTVRHAVMVKL